MLYVWESIMINQPLCLKQKLICYPACASITSLNLDSVVIAKGAFNNCSTGVEITGSVLEIEDRAFYNADIVYSATGTKKSGL